MVSPRHTSAAAELDIVRFGGPTVDHEFDVTIGSVQGELIGPNPDRLMLVITNNGANIVQFSTLTPVTVSRGHRLGSGQSLTISAFDDGSLVTRRLYAISSVDGQVLTLTEVERAHRGR